jgi:hypothetical protein
VRPPHVAAGAGVKPLPSLTAAAMSGCASCSRIARPQPMTTTISRLIFLATDAFGRDPQPYASGTED